MKAMVIPRFGGPEVFEAREVERPKPQPGEVLVRVVASGTNPVDAKLRQDGSWAGLKPPVVLGYDVAGVVEEVGPGVTAFGVGDEVYYTPEIFGNQRGSYAEFNAAPASIVALKPKGLTFEEAAAIPLAGGTAWEAIVRRLQVRPGETVLIHGGAGGVGSFAVQFAALAGAHVIATSSAEHLRTMEELGAEIVVDYKHEKPADVALRVTEGRGVDAVFSTVGGETVGQSLPALRPFGRIATILPPGGDLGPLSFRNQTLHGIFLTRERARLDEMRAVFERKKARVLVDRVLPLEKVGEAHRRLDSGHGKGKIVLRVEQ